MSGLIRYPINLGLWQDNTTGFRMRMGYLDLPSDLTVRDVERIVAMVRTLAPEEPQSIDAVDPVASSHPNGPRASKDFADV